ncbi:MAG: type I-F CRISPR-associated protein Csy3 [Azoarcus sp.]|jgi:CRISPR-associated protein Csy3|nr:type I-F CRISPR-associated protein Csy3 [Azoarcus sp.]
MSLAKPSNLAFERKLNPSDALLYAGNWNDKDRHGQWQPVTIQKKIVRGTKSSRGETHPEEANPQTVDVAALPADADTLKIQFTLRVLPGTGTPSACNNLAYRQKLEIVVADWCKKQGFGILAQRYACNLANGRFLWRNRIGAEQVEIHIAQLLEGQAESKWTFDALELSLRSFDKTTDALKEVAQTIMAGLQGQQNVLLQITAFVRIGNGQEVFPSQEFIMERNPGDKSKTLYQVNSIAAIHSQKIGNAIRTIDTWYPEAEDVSVAELGPIPVEPYGSVTTQGKAYRAPKNGNKDFYNLLDSWILKDKVPEPDDQNYVIAVLIRGGVFGEKEKG